MDRVALPPTRDGAIAHPEIRRGRVGHVVMKTEIASHVRQRAGPVFPGTQRLQTRLGEVDVLQIIDVLDDGLSYVLGLGAPGALGELLEPLFQIFRQADGQHLQLPGRFGI